MGRNSHSSSHITAAPRAAHILTAQTLPHARAALRAAKAAVASCYNDASANRAYRLQRLPCVATAAHARAHLAAKIMAKASGNMAWRGQGSKPSPYGDAGESRLPGGKLHYTVLPNRPCYRPKQLSGQAGVKMCSAPSGSLSAVLTAPLLSAPVTSRARTTCGTRGRRQYARNTDARTGTRYHLACWHLLHSPLQRTSSFPLLCTPGYGTPSPTCSACCVDAFEAAALITRIRAHSLLPRCLRCCANQQSIRFITKRKRLPAGPKRRRSSHHWRIWAPLRCAVNLAHAHCRSGSDIFSLGGRRRGDARRAGATLLRASCIHTALPFPCYHTAHAPCTRTHILLWQTVACLLLHLLTFLAA